MFIRRYKYTFLLCFCVFYVFRAQSQQKVLGLKEAVDIALKNYPGIKSKESQLNATKQALKETKLEYLPDLTLSAQQDYGTVNGQFGPSYGYKGLGVSSAGPTTAKQNWNAGFGSLYLSNVSWDFFAFGKSVEKVKVQQYAVNLNETDLQQAQFKHEILVAGAYLNLLAAKQLAQAQQDNLNRAIELQKVVVARVKNGLNPGVDSTQANAEVASARIATTNSVETERELITLLAQYTGLVAQDNFILDSIFVTKIPATIDPGLKSNFENHPSLKYFQNRIALSNQQLNYLTTFNYPTFSLFGVFQGKGSGFGSSYAVNQSSINSGYGAGADPTRFNYLLGFGVTWNLTTPFRLHYQLESQKYISEQYKNDYDQVSQQLKVEQLLAESRINNALKNFRDAPEEVKAAREAYNQKYTLYKNGLANIVDFTQALFVLNRAEVDNYIATNNVWQALLFKAAAAGDFGIFINNL